jgi:xanthine dehydrogenase accessory factor
MFDRGGLQAALAAQGRVARVVIAGVEGSSPREPGAAMLVWPGGQSGTIGGGALEWQAAAAARAQLAGGGTQVSRIPLGPALGQCCGGAVTLVTEVFADALPQAVAGMVARPLSNAPMPLAVSRILDRARAQGLRPACQIVQGWIVEPEAEASRALWVWGAGHVGRALVSVLAPLPDLAITWVDSAADRFPDALPAGVTQLTAVNPADLVPHAPSDAEHLVLTYSHALDLELCHRLLGHGFAGLGLIGSATKWARFRSRLAALGHAAPAIGRIRCPMGDPALGKHPQAIALGVAVALLTPRTERTKEIAL